MSRPKLYREPCGCAHNGPHWVGLCAEHETEFQSTHARWARERIETNMEVSDEDASHRP